MTGKRSISERTRKRVLAAMEQLAYEPNAGARALAGRRTQVIGLVVPFKATSDTAGSLPFIETIAGEARAHDHEVLLATSDEEPAGLPRLAGRSLCDAITMMDVREQDERVPVGASLPVPVVLVGLPDDPAGLFCVDLDFEAAARMAVDEFVDTPTQHDEIALLGCMAVMMDHPVNLSAGSYEPRASRRRHAGSR
ncbi:LacI family DNA-binding transcriptional regulator [Streptomyces hokutonensis]|uniref:LacI family DNA-binding transcriptional regulator n=1 Tax=Streptomyces hokutonensis TaxID=1306990 RepID=UPI0036A92AE7